MPVPNFNLNEGGTPNPVPNLSRDEGGTPCWGQTLTDTRREGPNASVDLKPRQGRNPILVLILNWLYKLGFFNDVLQKILNGLKRK